MTNTQHQINPSEPDKRGLTNLLEDILHWLLSSKIYTIVFFPVVITVALVLKQLYNKQFKGKLLARIIDEQGIETIKLVESK